MREDMAKVVVERPRTGGYEYRPGRDGGRRYQQRIRQDPDFARSFESTSRKRADRDKEPSDFLAPIYGYLRKQIGRPWNDVWSEICKTLPANSYMAQHVHGHIETYVERDVEYVNGVPCYSVDKKYFARIGLGGLYDQLYVCPNTGIVKLAPKKVPKVEKAPVTEVNIDKYHKAKKLDGLWYVVEYKKPKILTRLRFRTDWNTPLNSMLKGEKPQYEEYCLDRDIITGKEVERNYSGRYGERKSRWPAQFAFAKKSMSKKEMKKYLPVGVR